VQEGAGNYAHHCDTISGAAKAVKAAPAAAAATCNLTLTDVDASPCGLVATLVRGTERKFLKLDKKLSKRLALQNLRKLIVHLFLGIKYGI